MSQSFTFPPPPPPPPKRDFDSSNNSNKYSYPQSGQGRGRGNASFGGQQSFRGNNARGRGRGRGYGSNYGATNSRHGHDQTSQRRPSFGSESSSTKDLYISTPNSQTGFSVKRNHAAAFGNKPRPSSRPQAPPAVPSFNADIEKLISKTTQSQVRPKSPIPKKTNLLGLTPSAQLSESESEEDDDEARLAQLSGVDGLSFNHNGQTLSLRTPAEIAAWIAERKRKYPTNAKREAARREAEEKKRVWEAQKKERVEAMKLRQEERIKQSHEREKQKLKQRLLAQVTAKAKAALAAKNDDGSQRAISKAEKLKKDIERATKQLRDAEEALRKAQGEVDHTSDRPTDNQSNSDQHVDGTKTKPDINSGVQDTQSVDIGDSESEDISNEEIEDTSSSGSSDSDTDSAPEELPTTRKDDNHIAVQSQLGNQENAQVCRNYAKFGKCKFGRKCHYSHKMPKKVTKSNDRNAPVPGRRKGLYQIMVEKEQEEEQKLALRAIMALGDRGLLKNDSALPLPNPLQTSIS